MGPLGHACAMAGDEAEARRLLRELLELSERRPIEPYSVALIHAGLGEREQALEWLEKACANRGGFWTLHAKGDSRIDAFRSDPRFVSILRRMGLEQ
jgi:adenylate cyclase